MTSFAVGCVEMDKSGGDVEKWRMAFRLIGKEKYTETLEKLKEDIWEIHNANTF